jgi:hypothetical protein
MIFLFLGIAFCNWQHKPCTKEKNPIEKHRTIAPIHVCGKRCNLLFLIILGDMHLLPRPIVGFVVHI